MPKVEEKKEDGSLRDALVLRAEHGHSPGDIVQLTEDEITLGEGDGWLDGHPAAVAAAKG